MRGRESRPGAETACTIERDLLAAATVKSLLPPVSLEQINEVAHLQTRVDRKYLVPAEEAWDAIGRAGLGARILEIDGRRDVAYHSTYFDTADLTGFYGAARRRRRRFKVRLRGYGDAACFLEVKTRDGRGRSVKYRSPRPAEAEPKMREADLAEIRRALHADGIDPGALGPDGLLVAMLTTRYRRSTVYLPESGSRVTVDRDLVWGDPAGRELQLRDLVIVETKSAYAAGAVDRHLWRAGHRPRRLSKYGTGMTLFFPDLPANRWARVRAELDGHLRVIPSPSSGSQ